MLLPYCAKPSWCDYRYTDECGECGGCTVGDLYRMAYERGMIPITITSFEMLRDTLRWCAENGYTYIGHCCYEFFEKRYEIFSKAKEWGANGVLIDISGTTCYSLGVEEEEKAYRGEFQVELDLLVKDSERILSVKERMKNDNGERRKGRPNLAEPLKDFLPERYRIPKVVPGPEEDRTRLLIAKEGSFIRGEKVTYKRALEEAFRLLMKASKPTVVVGPLVLWNWNGESEEQAKIIRKLVDLFPKLNVHLLPDYRPGNGDLDPAREIDPPKPHISIIHGNHDLTILIGIHCYRTDFLIRSLKRHTDTVVVAFCNSHGHPNADVSVGGINSERLKEFVELNKP